MAKCKPCSRAKRRSRGLSGAGDWQPEGKYTTCELARRRTESPQGYGNLLKYGLVEVKYVDEPSASRPGQTSCRVYSRATGKSGVQIRGRR